MAEDTSADKQVVEKKKIVTGRRMSGCFPIDPKTGEPVKPSKPPIFEIDVPESRPGHAFEGLDAAHRALGKSKSNCLPPLSYPKKEEAVKEEDKKPEIALKELPKSQMPTYKSQGSITAKKLEDK